MKKKEHEKRIARCRLLMKRHETSKDESNIAYKAGYPRIAHELLMERYAAYHEIMGYFQDSRCDNIYPNDRRDFIIWIKTVYYG